MTTTNGTIPAPQREPIYRKVVSRVGMRLRLSCGHWLPLNRLTAVGKWTACGACQAARGRG